MKRTAFIAGCALASILTGCAGIYGGGGTDPAPKEWLRNLSAVDFNDDWALAFECDCHFLVAECLTRHILSLSHAESDLPADLWAGRTASLDPFAGLGEADLRVALNSGSKHVHE